MSTIRINETTFSITSTLTMAQLKTLKAKAPQALQLTKPGKKTDDPDEILFAIAPSAKQSMSTYGICFAKSAFGTDNAIYVEDLPTDLENLTKAKEHVAERVGFAKKYLDEIETHAAATLAQLKADHDSIIAGIEVATPAAPANETANETAAQ